MRPSTGAAHNPTKRAIIQLRLMSAVRRAFTVSPNGQKKSWDHKKFLAVRRNKTPPAPANDSFKIGDLVLRAFKTLRKKSGRNPIRSPFLELCAKTLARTAGFVLPVLDGDPAPPGTSLYQKGIIMELSL